MCTRLLVVDDNRSIVDYLVEVLGDQYETSGETSPESALERIRREDFDVVISDVEMRDLRGPDLLAAILEARPHQAVLLTTPHDSIELAVETVRAGACDFVTKPLERDTVVVAIERALRERAMRREIVRLRRDLGDDSDGLVSASTAMTSVLEVARRAARSDSAVLITGESGIGTAALARWIHERSSRRDGPMVQIHCAALPEGLIEAELFGVKRGSFTDARESRDGLFVDASGGTLFLDEIAAMPLDAQGKLLDVLESSRVRPVGSTEAVSSNVRVIAATHRDLVEAVRLSTFRSDLFFRLNVVRIEIPPLRERPEDIPPLVYALLTRVSQRGRAPLGITDEATRWLCQQPWPGNVRELANVIERAVALSEHDTIEIEDVRDHGALTAEPEALDLSDAASRHLPLADIEVAYVKQVVSSVGGNLAQAARVLGIDRHTLYRKLGS